MIKQAIYITLKPGCESAKSWSWLKWTLHNFSLRVLQQSPVCGGSVCSVIIFEFFTGYYFQISLQRIIKYLWNELNSINLYLKIKATIRDYERLVDPKCMDSGLREAKLRCSTLSWPPGGSSNCSGKEKVVDIFPLKDIQYIFVYENLTRPCQIKTAKTITNTVLGRSL